MVWNCHIDVVREASMNPNAINRIPVIMTLRIELSSTALPKYGPDRPMDRIIKANPMDPSKRELPNSVSKMGINTPYE